MGIIVKVKNVDGVKIIDYSCEKDGVTIKLTKEQLKDAIDRKEVENAVYQTWQGSFIIRPKGKISFDTYDVKLNKFVDRTRKKKDDTESNKEDTKLKNDNTAKKDNKKKEVKSQAYATDVITSEELMVKIAKRFGITDIMPYMNKFFQLNPDLRNKMYNENDIEASEISIDNVKEMIYFWNLAINNQTNRIRAQLDKSVDDILYKNYCLKNGIDYEEE